MKKLYPLLSALFLIYWGCEEQTEEDTMLPFQTFSNTYGTGTGLKIRDNTDGEFYSILSNLNAYDFDPNPQEPDVYDYAIVNIDYLGEEIDRISLDLDSTFRPNGHNFTTDNGIVIIGNSYGKDIYIVKYSAAGIIEWTKRIGSDYESEYLPPDELWLSDSSCAEFFYQQGSNAIDYGHEIIQTSDNGYIITGCFECRYIRSDLYVIKLDENGNYEWIKCFPFIASGMSILEIDDGYLVTGVIVDPEYISDYSDAFLLKISKEGEQIWLKTFDFVQGNVGGGAALDWGREIQESSDNYFLRGRGFVKTDLEGNEIWRMDGVGNSFDIVNDEDVVFTGTNWEVNFSSLYISYYSSEGDSLWTENFGDSSEYSYGTSILSIDGGYIMSGQKNEEIWLLKVDEDGILEE